MFVNNSGDPDIVAVNNANSAYANLKLEGATLQFRIAGGYKGQFDTSGNLMVGRSSLGISNTGHTLAAAGYVEFTRDGAAALNVGRNSSVGDTAVFWKDGSEAGAIGSAGGSANEIYFAARAGKALLINNNGLLAGTQSGGGSDNTTDLGQSDVRWKDLHLSNIGYAGASFRAPIFYDSDNTSYYIDGASNSNFYQVRAQNGGIIAGTLSQPTSMGQIAIYSGSNPYMSWHNGATNARHGYIQHLSDADRFYF